MRQGDRMARLPLPRHHHYPPVEEWLNIISHAAGLVLGIAGFVLLVVRAATHGDALHVVSFAVFGARRYADLRSPP